MPLTGIIAVAAVYPRPEKAGVRVPATPVSPSATAVLSRSTLHPPSVVAAFSPMDKDTSIFTLCPEATVTDVDRPVTVF